MNETDLIDQIELERSVNEDKEKRRMILIGLLSGIGALILIVVIILIVVCFCANKADKEVKEKELRGEDIEKEGKQPH